MTPTLGISFLLKTMSNIISLVWKRNHYGVNWSCSLSAMHFSSLCWSGNQFPWYGIIFLLLSNAALICSEDEARNLSHAVLNKLSQQTDAEWSFTSTVQCNLADETTRQSGRWLYNLCRLPPCDLFLAWGWIIWWKANSECSKDVAHGVLPNPYCLGRFSNRHCLLGILVTFFCLILQPSHYLLRQIQVQISIRKEPTKHWPGRLALSAEQIKKMHVFANMPDTHLITNIHIWHI